MLRRPLPNLLFATLVLVLPLLGQQARAGELLAQTSTVPAHSSQTQPLARMLSTLAPEADRRVLRLAARAVSCAGRDADQLAIIDYSLPSTQPRLWVFDLVNRTLTFKELVAHGRGSGNAQAMAFSNVPDSWQSSLGLFRTLNSYQGSNGYSLRLEGLEPGVNDKAFERAIVIHGADYADEEFIAKTGRLGRSHGCPAVREDIASPLIDSIKDGQYLFVYYPDADWLNSSRFLHCDSPAPQLASQ
ncbi:murein L,D-transpeptidase catalytic domain family protein [Halomonas sp. McH1-25]|uniref:murein L,D-transpeptidase catalytic domain family protein n=1 Tax=unclassified Halomonas TaxID=2609666 RepID=UPI001EF5DAC8|nr:MULTISPECIES: murein L,D-transpeptidase catalytic domain family protein [unclassified Halomonas]MCG7600908.1 murein L,D-transpeptidase catalytic domain family protein [Halomonas sp. McH1-25]MCP1341496.1 murein L,D-transpeptidase catalytic domain family protein [Halomonas sp. FL8]MCP1360087.1 murein L,D-transpeptidase catalytic domain family protein [Halomonas sp. BBD45]MCP1364025.1 murein L,D-transpeptidase catalytic domain family protein [Halomonas sp. BBD48]